ncbi:hypothetical protein OLEAN_C10860 [Oleispira antarctica RB-8]|uniref:Uncharacterized protein n=1 Tax=Oleispira antarctica RB-8 TaxID=698738 RepID=R4YL20_OLEAN|nr:hypothetical protein OLEAN_C10860 [Oleispira antarctica RB-8]
MNPAQSITFPLAVTYLIAHGLYSVNVKGRHLRVFYPENNYNEPHKPLKYNGFLIDHPLFLARSLIISIGFLSLVFIYSIGLITSQ